MKALWVVAALLVLVLAVAVLFRGLGGLVDRWVAASLRRRARRALATRSEAELLGAIDAEIAALEAKVEQSKREAANLAGKFGVMGHIEGPYSRIRELRRYRLAIQQVAEDRAAARDQAKPDNSRTGD